MSFRRPSRRTRLSAPIQLEDRSVPAVFTATIDPATNNDAAVAELVGFFSAVNANADLNDTINLFPGGRYVFNHKASDPTFGANADPAAYTDGGTALPVFRTLNSNPVPDLYNTFNSVLSTTLTINGNNAAFVRPAGAESFRFLRAFGAVEQNTTPAMTIVTPDGKGGFIEVQVPAVTTTATVLATMNVNNLTMSGGNVFDFRGIDLATNTKISEPAGGAIRTDLAQVNVTGAIFDSNTSTLGGGAVYLGPTIGVSTISTFDTVKFFNNFAGTQGGAAMIDNTGDTVIESTGFFRNTTIQENLSLTGAGGVHGLVASAEFDGVAIIGNRGNAGGIEASAVAMNRTLIGGNTATGTGTGAVTATEQMLIATNSTITGNRSGEAGAVVGQGSGLAVEFINSTLHNNLGGNSALQATKGEVVLAFATVTNNTTSGGDTAGISVPNNILTISQSVISGNRVPNTQSQFSDIQSPLLRNQGYNFIGITPNSFVPAIGDKAGKVGAELDPLLGPLGNNGGPTIGFPGEVNNFLPTRLPAVGSPLLGAVAKVEATRLLTDERGLPRPTANADIGALQVQAGEVQPTPTPLPPPLVPPPPPITGPLVPPPPPSSRPPVIAAGPGPLAASLVNGSLPPPGFLEASGSIPGGGSGANAVPTVPNTAVLLNKDGTVKIQVTPFAASVPGGLRVAAGDLTGDGVADLAVATGPGALAQVAVFDGVSGALITTLTPFGDFTGGLFVAIGDLTGDGAQELIVSPDTGGGPRVVAFESATYTPVLNFFGIDDPNFRGGVRVAVGDIDGDGVGDLLVAAGTGGGPRVTIWKGGTPVDASLTVTLANFFVFEPGLRNGVYIAAGDVNADGFSDAIVGAGPGGAPRVLVLSGKLLSESQGQVQDPPIANFFAGDPNRRDGVPVSASDLDAAENADVVTGGGSTSTVNVYLGQNLSNGNVDPVLPPLTPFGAYNGGVFVG